MKNYHIKARLEWEPFEFEGNKYPLTHLKAHEVIYKGQKDTYKFIVTYSLHCFAKDDQEHSIPLKYSDSRESRQINLERYHASKELRGIIEKLDTKGKLVYETDTEKCFNIEMMNSLNQKIEPYKICFHFFKENRMLRIHVTSAFFDRKNKPILNKSYSVFKIAMDTKKRAKNKGIPKEACNM